MIDFTNCTEKINKFRGSEKKKTIEYNGKTYLLKFPDPTREKGRLFLILIIQFQNILDVKFMNPQG